jgi:hypothetical protein
MMQRFNSTIRVKKRQLDCGCFDYSFSKNRCKLHAYIEDNLKRLNENDDENLSELISECDVLFSKYIRMKYADKKGIVKCYTCEKPFKISEVQNGHYISRYNLFLRFDERNCRPQCEYCNCHKRGNLLIFGKKLEAEHEGITEILLEESHIIYKPTREELKQLALDLKTKISKLSYSM